MKKVLMFGVFLGVIASIQAKEISTIPIEVERNINKFYQGADFSQKNQHINMQRKAYLEMVNYIEEANIFLERKRGY